MIILFVSLAVFVVLGIPIAYSLGLSALFYFVVFHPEFLLVLPQRIFSGMDSYAMIALPFFMLMGSLMNEGGLTTRIIDFNLIFVGRFRGGLGLVNVVANMVFGGISGSSVSDAAAIGSVLIPEMKKKGYTTEVASGITAAASTMGIIIPPSIPMVVYGFVAQESIGKLFLAGAIPGIMIGLVMMMITLWIAIVKKFPVEKIKLTPLEIFNRFKGTFLAMLMPILVIGTVVTGIATATETAGIGCLYAFIMGAVIYRGLKLKSIPPLFKSAIVTSANIMLIMAFSTLYIWILALEHIPELVASCLMSVNVPLFVILLFFDIILLIIGTFIDITPAILLVTPVFLPALSALGVSPVHFGTILVVGLAIGLVTPPVGMCLNVVSAISGLDIVRIFRAAIPFLIANLIILILVTLIPQISLWLPALLMD